MKSKIEIKRMLESDPSGLLDHLLEIINDEDSEIANNIILKKAELKELKKEEKNGVLSYDEKSRRLANVRVNILNIIDEIPAHYFKLKSERNTTNFNQHENAMFLHVTKLMGELMESNIQQAKLEDFYRENIIASYINTKKHVIVDQIVKLVEMNNFILSGTEYRIIAEVYHNFLIVSKAEEFYKKAIDTIDEYTDSAIAKIINIRSYAHFLYTVHRAEEGANQYKSAILAGDTDNSNMVNGLTYQMMFGNEIDIENIDKAISAYRQAKEYYLKIKSVMNRNHNLKILEGLWNSKEIPVEYSRP